LFAELKNSKVVHAVLYGENRFELLKSAGEEGFDSFSVCGGGLSFALRVACLKAESGQTILLSPASASFDEFDSYEERGERFAEIVKTIAEEEEGKERYCKSMENEEVCVDESRG
jgi:UDP-N-acetylmuramoylalanine--D-glutamate ligase